MTGTVSIIFWLVFLVGSISATKGPKIIGGHNAVIKHFPYLVSIRLYGRHICAGSIISERHILTAAHCTAFFNSDEIRHVMTIHSGTSRAKEPGTVHKILAVHSHPEFISDIEDKNHFHDIAIITLEEPMNFNKYRQKINLPSHDIQKHQVAYGIGWGRISLSDPTAVANQLQKLRLVLFPSNECKLFVSREIRQEQFCSFRSVGKGLCQGDSGGPLVSHGEVVGIVSYGDGGICGEDIPTVCTNVFGYKGFIESVVNKYNQ